MPLTVLIAEDDLQMRRVLKKAAEENNQVRVMGEAEDGTEALALFKKLRPNVVFIDIDLPGMDGVTLAREIFDLDPQVRLVFITALDQYREEAFDVYACDYLVKPFKMERLRQTLERLCLPSLNHCLTDTSTGVSRLFGKGSEMALLELKDILYITREGRHTVVYHVNGRLKTSENLNDLETELDGYPFSRTHKGFIVNLKMVRKIVPVGRKTFELVMAHTTERPLLTREKYRTLKLNLKVESNTGSET